MRECDYVCVCISHLPNAHVYLNTSYFNFDMPIILRVYRLACPFRFTFFAPLSFSIYSLPTFVRCVVFCKHWTKKCHFPPNDLYAFPYLLITLYSHHGCIYHCKASENTSFIFIDWFDTERKNGTHTEQTENGSCKTNKWGGNVPEYCFSSSFKGMKVICVNFSINRAIKRR